jgi:hypothetical protein
MDADRKAPRTYKDVEWIGVFVLHLACVVALGCVYTPELIAVSRSSTDGSKSTEDGELSADVSAALKHVTPIAISFLGVGVGVSIGWSLLWVSLVQRFAKQLIKIALLFMPVLLAVLAGVTLLAGSAFTAMLLLFLCGIFSFYAYWIFSQPGRIEFAQLTLESISAVVKMCATRPAPPGPGGERAPSRAVWPCTMPAGRRDLASRRARGARMSVRAAVAWRARPRAGGPSAPESVALALTCALPPCACLLRRYPGTYLTAFFSTVPATVWQLGWLATIGGTGYHFFSRGEQVRPRMRTLTQPACQACKARRTTHGAPREASGAVRQGGGGALPVRAPACPASRVCPRLRQGERARWLGQPRPRCSSRLARAHLWCSLGAPLSGGGGGPLRQPVHAHGDRAGGQDLPPVPLPLAVLVRAPRTAAATRGLERARRADCARRARSSPRPLVLRVWCALSRVPARCREDRTAQVIQNVVHVTTSGVVATWYFRANAMPTSPSLQSFKRATSTSFGSIWYARNPAQHLPTDICRQARARTTHAPRRLTAPHLSAPSVHFAPWRPVGA